MIECMKNTVQGSQEGPIGMTDETKEEIQIVLQLLKTTLMKNHVSMATDSKGNIYFIDTDAYVSQNKKSGFSVSINDLVKNSMERLTDKNDDENHFYPKCFEKCGGLGASRKCDNCEVTTSICEKLGKYEDLEEQGLILRLPCRVGTIVYVLQSDRIIKVIITRYDCFKDGSIWFCFNHGCGKSIAEFGKTVFLTREEAEAKLKETEGADGK